MKKRVLFFVLAAIMAIFCISCGDSVQGDYRKYEAESDVFSFYISMTLKGGSYTFEEVTKTNSTTTYTPKSKGKYSAKNSEITFTENSSNYTFKGTLTDGVLVFTYNSIEYAVKKQ